MVDKRLANVYILYDIKAYPTMLYGLFFTGYFP